MKPFLKPLGSLLAALCFLWNSSAAEGPKLPAKPNILFCFADDWGRYASIYASVEPRPSIIGIAEIVPAGGPGTKR